MKQGGPHRSSTRKVPIRRMAGAVVALGGLSGLVSGDVIRRIPNGSILMPPR
jgi:hypothetical protein